MRLMLIVLSMLVMAGHVHALPEFAATLSTPERLKQIATPVDYSLLTETKAGNTRRFSGELTFKPSAAKANLKMTEQTTLKDIAARTVLPGIEFTFVADQTGQAIPAEKGVRVTSHPVWDYVIGTGKVWSDGAMGQQAYILFPLHLLEKNQNCVHNGVLAVSLNMTARTANSYYQIVSETCGYFKADMWGTLKTEFQPADADIAEENVNAAPLSLEQFAERYPQVNLHTLRLEEQVPQQDISVMGWVTDGLHYQSQCPTRQGPYPFCSQLLLPSYSTAKSIVAANTLMHMVHVFPQLQDASVADWVPECNSQLWQDVSLTDLLNMSTGNYLSADYHADEGAEHSLVFFDAVTHQDKVDYACNQFRRQAQPGSTFVYHTSDTYLLGVALSNFLSAQSGHDTGLFETVLINNLYRGLTLSEPFTFHRQSAGKPYPFFGYGSYLYVADMLEILTFTRAQLNNPSSQLDPGMLRQALQSGPGFNGLPTVYPTLGYSLGYWALNVTERLGCQQETWLPFLSGYGGIVWVLLPDDRLFYYVSDGYTFRWLDAVAELHKLQPLCAT